MSPEDKSKLQHAWRKATERNPDADKPIPGWFMTENGDEPVTPRKLMEGSLADEQTYKNLDKVLAANPGLTLDKIIEINFGPKPPKL